MGRRKKILQDISNPEEKSEVLKDATLVITFKFSVKIFDADAYSLTHDPSLVKRCKIFAQSSSCSNLVWSDIDIDVPDF